jgi:GNAT superfamily N-acetyltransferase
MHFREATINDIDQLQHVRGAVKENVLSTSSLVTHADYIDYLTCRGKGWVGESSGTIVGFAVADLQANNIWALFLLPEFERRGIGRALHNLMLAWYFSQTQETVWLSTAPGSRAEGFYRNLGWTENGLHSNGEIRFEMDFTTWCELSGQSTVVAALPS